MGVIYKDQFAPVGEQFVYHQIFPCMIAKSILHKSVAASFYSTLVGAVNDVNAGTIGANANAAESDAVACVYTDKGRPNVVLLKDTKVDSAVAPSVDMTINLGGCVLSREGTIAIDVMSGNLTIDGRVRGSTVKSVSDGTNVSRAVQIRSGSVTVFGGTIISSNSGSGKVMPIYAGSATTFNAYGASILAESTNNISYAVNINKGAFADIRNCSITAKSKGNSAFGVMNFGAGATVRNCHVESYANYPSDLSARSLGINNQGVLEVYNSNVMGTHSGILNTGGELYVNGGVYEAFGHGGMYITGGNTHVENATLRECAMVEGYVDTAGTNGAGFYIGDGSSLSVYMDNCDIYGSRQPIVLRGSGGEQNNSLYISNSGINLDYSEAGVRIDNDTHKLYLGVGNNFTAEDTNRPSAVINTDAVYINSNA